MTSANLSFKFTAANSNVLARIQKEVNDETIYTYCLLTAGEHDADGQVFAEDAAAKYAAKYLARQKSATEAGRKAAASRLHRFFMNG